MIPYKMNPEIAPVKKAESLMKKISDTLFPFKTKSTGNKDENQKSFGEIFDEQLKKYDGKAYSEGRYNTLVPEIKLNEAMMNFTRRSNVIVSFDLKTRRDKQ